VAIRVLHRQPTIPSHSTQARRCFISNTPSHLLSTTSAPSTASASIVGAIVQRHVQIFTSIRAGPSFHLGASWPFARYEPASDAHGKTVSHPIHFDFIVLYPHHLSCDPSSGLFSSSYILSLLNALVAFYSSNSSTSLRTTNLAPCNSRPFFPCLVPSAWLRQVSSGFLQSSTLARVRKSHDEMLPSRVLLRYRATSLARHQRRAWP